MAAEAVAILPEDLLADVLGRLPARSLVAFRRVCKAWRDLVDERDLVCTARRPLPRSVRGLFINFQDYGRPHFFARPASATDGPPIDGEFDYVVKKKKTKIYWYSWYEVLDHCNGLVLYWNSDHDVMYVCNPTKRRWRRLPPRSGEPFWSRRDRAFLVFDPAASPHNKVLVAPEEPRKSRDVEENDDDPRRLMEWPPSPWTWEEFSSKTGRWGKKVFLRDGAAAGTVGDLLFQWLKYHGIEPPWRYAAYWQGELYIHCHGEYVSRLSLLNDTYKVIKSPIDLEEMKKDEVRTFLGRSEKGVYFAAIDYKDYMDNLRVWILSESNDQAGWVSKHHGNLNKTNSVESHKDKYTAPWTLDIHNTKKNQEVLSQQDVCWNSDDDDIINVLDDQDKYSDGYIKFLGFHPYKEVIFLCREGRTVVAYHFNSSKVQYLGQIDPCTYNRGQRESFVYTPCLIGDLHVPVRAHAHFHDSNLYR